MKLKQTHVQKLARVLKVLVTVVFVCNLIALFLAPGLAFLRGEEDLLGLMPCQNPLRLAILFAKCWSWPLWIFAEDLYGVVLALFLLFCGVCTAVILWQARRVLGTICVRSPFCLENAASMRRAAVCCFVISGAALARTIWGFCYYRSIAPLLTYNFLFVPLFLMAGLVCMVMSALFRQAAELKAENDLTI